MSEGDTRVKDFWKPNNDSAGEAEVKKDWARVGLGLAGSRNALKTGFAQIRITSTLVLTQSHLSFLQKKFFAQIIQCTKL